MTIEFLTDDYEWTYGHAPRGRGSWAFAEDRNADCLSGNILWSPSMTYTEAKKWAREELKRRNLRADALWVLT